MIRQATPNTRLPAAIHRLTFLKPPTLPFETPLGLQSIYCLLKFSTHCFYFQLALLVPHWVKTLDGLDHSALPFKGSPLFLKAGQGVQILLPPGVPSLSISSSVLLLKPKELKPYKRMVVTLLAFTSKDTSCSFQALLGVVELCALSPALELKTCFYLFYRPRIHLKRVLCEEIFENH